MDAMMLLLLALAPLVQDPAPAPSDAEVIAGVALQANDRIVTLREFDLALSRVAAANGVPRSDPRYLELGRQAIPELSKNELEPQAGEDMGFDPARVESIVKRNSDDTLRERGAADFADLLAEEGADLRTFEEQQKSDLYRGVWRGVKTGQENLPERPRTDRFIRPGQLKAIYRVVKDRLDPMYVVLQVIQQPVRSAYGGNEAGGIEYLEGARQRALAGEDFTDLVREFGAAGTPNDGLTERLAVDLIGVPELQEFARDAAVGEIGPVIATDLSGERVLILARLHAREGGRIPPYEDRATQNELRDRLMRQRVDEILGRGREELLDEAYLWVSPHLDFLEARR